MEVTRARRSTATCASASCSAQQMLRGDIEGDDLEQYVEERVLFTTLENAQNWARANASVPLGFGLACCAIEMISVIGSPRNDLARFGAEAIRCISAPGRHADPVGPRVDQDGADHPPPLRPDARAEVGHRDGRLLVERRACSTTTRVVAGADKFLPIDVYVPGCPPRPEALIYGIIEAAEQDQGRARHGLAGALPGARAPEEVA